MSLAVKELSDAAIVFSKLSGDKRKINLKEAGAFLPFIKSKQFPRREEKGSTSVRSRCDDHRKGQCFLDDKKHSF